VVVFDEWYMSREVIEFLNNRCLTWVSMAKSNRLILQEDEKWSNLKDYSKEISKDYFKRINQEMGEKRFRWLYETTVVMKNVGEVKLVILKERINSKKCMFLVSNDIMMDGMKIFEYYK
ncbi:hypothetical protein B6U81_03795, partial [Thermoplasmatales archaeon ex4484_30]